MNPSRRTVASRRVMSSRVERVYCCLGTDKVEEEDCDLVFLRCCLERANLGGAVIRVGCFE